MYESNMKNLTNSWCPINNQFLVLHPLLKGKKDKNHRNEFWEGLSKISELKHLFQITFVLIFGKMRIWPEIKVRVGGLPLMRQTNESLSLDSAGYLTNALICLLHSSKCPVYPLRPFFKSPPHRCESDSEGDVVCLKL